MREEGNRNYVLIKYFNTFMYYHKLYRRRKHFCRYCLQVFSTEEILERHIKDCLKVNGKQKDYNGWKSEYVKSKNHDREIKSPFMIYADFESILVAKIMESKI